MDREIDRQIGRVCCDPRTVVICSGDKRANLLIYRLIYNRELSVLTKRMRSQIRAAEMNIL